ncbi:GNAT family N-acetyltransferase [Candidatus Omnitrophota bacterium]
MVNDSVKIYKARESDWPYIQEKLQKYLLDATDADWKDFFVLKKGERTVAFARILDHAEYFELASLGVDYYYRKKGFGKRMLEFLIQEARSMDSGKPIYGVTHLPVLLKKVGFQEVNSYPENLDHKKNNICKYPHKIVVVKYHQEDHVARGV